MWSLVKKKLHPYYVIWTMPWKIIVFDILSQIYNLKCILLFRGSVPSH